MVSAKDAISIYQLLMDNDIRVWLTGGWGIDALLGEQTRTHKDLDVILLFEDIQRLRELLALEGYELMRIWEENRWVVDEDGVETATAFVLVDPQGRELDVHAIHFDDQGIGIPTWNNDEGLTFRPEDLSGQGLIDGNPVRCLSVEMQVTVHQGYELPDYQIEDLHRLRVKFGMDGG